MTTNEGLDLGKLGHAGLTAVQRMGPAMGRHELNEGHYQDLSMMMTRTTTGETPSVSTNPTVAGSTATVLSQPRDAPCLLCFAVAVFFLNTNLDIKSSRLLFIQPLDRQSRSCPFRVEVTNKCGQWVCGGDGVDFRGGGINGLLGTKKGISMDEGRLRLRVLNKYSLSFSPSSIQPSPGNGFQSVQSAHMTTTSPSPKSIIHFSAGLLMSIIFLVSGVPKLGAVA